MSDTITCDFVFVPEGAPWPRDWVQRHPEHIVLPARFAGSPDFLRRMLGPRPGDPVSADKPSAQRDLLPTPWT